MPNPNGRPRAQRYTPDEWEGMIEQFARDAVRDRPRYYLTDAAEMGPLISQLRTEMGMTQMQVAVASGGSVHTNLSAYEGGRKVPDLSTSIKYLRVFGYRIEIVPIEPD